jgi:tRNA pseudouridine13 synthase
VKIKVQPDDFYVEEFINHPLGKTGQYSIYKLEKRFWDTFDLLDYLSRKYKFRNIGRAGIKDRYSHSVQYISVKGVKEKEIKEDNFKLDFIGKSDLPITQNDLVKNKFTIVIRDLNEKEAEYIQNNVQSLTKFGFPNYYDEQRMGSARAKQGFIAEKLILKHYNGALKLYLATSSSFDDSRTRKLKKYLEEHWTDWKECLKTPYPLGQNRYPLLYLAEHPKDFKGALKTIRRDLLEMFINAYQAYVWNETLKGLLEIEKVETFKRKYRFGDLYFYDEIAEEKLKYFQEIFIPAVSYKTQFNDNKIEQAVEQVLAIENKSLKDFKIDLNIKGLFFKPYERNAIVIPEDFTINNKENDELYPKKLKLTLSFALPKGSYATILLKRVTSL